MDNPNASDDEIELLTGEERSVGEEEQNQELYTNPLNLFHRCPSEDESINPASYHALQTAVTSMQHKLNDNTKKYNELMQKNKLMQKALFDMSKQAGDMDDLCQQEPSIVHAAGAGAGCSSEDETVIAEQRAKQGYISHLEREVLRNTSAIARANDEIQRLKRKLEDQDKEKKALLQRLEKVQLDYDICTRNSEENIRLRKNKIEELEQHQKFLYQENVSLKENLEQLDRNSSKDLEIRDLKTKLTVAETEMTKLTIQYRELDRNMHEKEEELSRLKSKCKQYDIEAEINRKRRLYEGSDELDGDTEVLTKALEMIQSQRIEVTNLRSHVQQQTNVIKELVIATEKDTKPVCKCQPTIPEERGVAQGASINFHVEEQRPPHTSGSPVFENTQPVQEQISSHTVSPIARRQSDRGDYRGRNRQSPRTTSPRVKENFVPTGSTHIPEMLANEDTHLTRRPGSNVFDNFSRPSHLSPRSLAQSPQPMYMNTQGFNGQRLDQEPTGRVRSPQISPRPVNNHYENMETTTQIPAQHGLSIMKNGARPKTNYAHDDCVQNHYQEQGSVTNNRLPDRMTQSAIVLRDDSDYDDIAMSRSMFSPNIVGEEKTTERNDGYLNTQQEFNWSQAKQKEESAYRKNVRTGDNGPDYENILSVAPVINSRRPVEEHEEILPVTEAHTANIVSQSVAPRQIVNNAMAESQTEMNQTEDSEVSALKICPVCNLEFSRMTMDQFQTHVFECFDNCEEPQTLQPNVVAGEDDRNCPMCGEVFPMTIPQETYEQHVLAHFGEEPMMERFELLNS